MKPTEPVNYFDQKKNLSSPQVTGSLAGPNKNNISFKAQGDKSFFNFLPKKIFIPLVIIILAIALPLTVGLLKNQQDVRQRAAASTTISIGTPPALDTACGPIELPIILDPGTNAVSTVDFYINYSADKLELIDIKPNTEFFPDIARDLQVSSGSANILITIGDNVAKAIQSSVLMGHLVFKATGPLSNASISVNTGSTKVYSIAPDDSETENVLSSVENAEFATTDTGTCLITPTPSVTSSPSISPTPTDAACPPPNRVNNVLVEYPHCEGTNCSFDQANCSWSSLSGATGYEVTVSQVESGGQIFQQSVSPQTTKVVFDITQNKTYKCEVSAVNSCGVGVANSHSLLCSTQIEFPTGSPTPTPTPPACQLPSPVTNLKITCPTCDLTTRP